MSKELQLGGGETEIVATESVSGEILSPIEAHRAAAKKALGEGKYMLRSCWKCNAAHEHLKESESVLQCFECGRWFFKGVDVTEDDMLEATPAEAIMAEVVADLPEIRGETGMTGPRGEVSINSIPEMSGEVVIDTETEMWANPPPLPSNARKEVADVLKQLLDTPIDCGPALEVCDPVEPCLRCDNDPCSCVKTLR